MSIPDFNAKGELPAGEHQATLDEIEIRYGRSSRRRKDLMKGLRQAGDKLAKAGVQMIWVNGSFITTKENPNDIDGCWAYNDAVDIQTLSDDFLSMDARQIVKNKYGLDFFIAQWMETGSGKPFPLFFQMNRDGEAKGIIVVNLGD